MQVDFHPGRFFRAAGANLARTLGGFVLLALAVVGTILLGSHPQLAVLGNVAAAVIGGVLVYVLLSSGLLVTTTTTTQARAPAEQVLHTSQEFLRLVTGLGRPVLIVLDNLDRLPAKDALLALAEIRSFVEVQQSQCIFLIPVDREALSNQLLQELQDEVTARDFLDKFFNLDVTLTAPPVVDIRQWVRTLAERLFGKSEEILALTQVVAAASRRTPRVAKRLLNGVLLRSRALGDNSLGLAQIALVEALVVRFPFLVPEIESRPRRIVDLRESLATLETRDERLVAFRAFVGKEQLSDLETDLLDYLLETRDLNLGADALQRIATLRMDRLWVGVPDAVAIENALRTGQPDQVSQSLEGISPPDQERALEAAVLWAESSLEQGYRRDAMNAVVALSAVVTDDIRHAQRIRRVGYEVILGGWSEGIRNLDEAATNLLVGDQAQPLQARSMWRASVVVLEGSDATQASRPLAVLSQAARWATESELDQGQDVVADAFGRGADLAPLFDTPGLRPELVDGRLPKAIAATLSDWSDDRPSDWPERARWLGICQENGWRDLDVLDEMATAATGQLPSAAATEDGRMRLRAVAAVLKSAGPSESIDNLAEALAEAAGPKIVTPLVLAYMLPVSEDAETRIRATTNTWVSTAEVGIIERLVAPGAVDESRLDPWAAIRSRWIGGDGTEFLSILINDGDRGRAEVPRGLEEESISYLGSTLLEVLEVSSGGDAELVSQCLTVVAGRSEVPMLSLATELPDISRKASLLGANLEPLADKLRTQLPSIASQPDLAAIAPGARALADALDIQSEVADLLAERAIAVGLPRSLGEWLFVNSSRTADLRRVLQDEVRTGDIRESLAFLQPLRRHLRYHGGIAGALAERINVGDMDCAAMLDALEEAGRWHEGIGRHRDQVLEAMQRAGPCEGSGPILATVRMRLDPR
jgi:hypothetical protein